MTIDLTIDVFSVAGILFDRRRHWGQVLHTSSLATTLV